MECTICRCQNIYLFVVLSETGGGASLGKWTLSDISRLLYASTSSSSSFVRCPGEEYNHLHQLTQWRVQKKMQLNICSYSYTRDKSICRYDPSFFFTWARVGLSEFFKVFVEFKCKFVKSSSSLSVSRSFMNIFLLIFVFLSRCCFAM